MSSELNSSEVELTVYIKIKTTERIYGSVLIQKPCQRREDLNKVNCSFIILRAEVILFTQE